MRHALLLGVLLHLARTQAFEHVAQFAEKLLRLVAGPGPGHVLDGVEHLVEVLRGDRLEVLHVRQFGDVAGVLHPPGHFLHELVQRLAQFLHQAGNLLIGRVALERLLQGFLGCAQVPRDVRQVAILDEKRHLPEHVHDRTQRVVVTGQPQPVGGRAQPQVNRRRHIEHIRRQRQQFQRPPDRALAGAVEREHAALLHQRARQRLAEYPLRQLEADRFGHAALAGVVAGLQRQHDIGAGPGVRGQVLHRLRAAGARAQLRQRQLEFRAPGSAARR